MRGRYFAAVAFAAIAIIAAENDADRQQQLWRHRNLGKALFETPTTINEAPAELKKALELAPDSFRDRLNYGLALLRSGDLDHAIAELEKAQKQDPALPYTWFNLGIAYKRQRRYDDAVRQFRRMVQLVPEEPVAHYNLGLIDKQLGRDQEALQEFETAAKLDPRLVAARFQIYNYYRLRDDEAAADRAREAFEEAKRQQKAADETEDMEWCYYAELYDPEQARPHAQAPRSPAQAKYEHVMLARAADPKTAGLLAVDVDGDLKPDLIVWSRNGIDLYRNGRDWMADSGLSSERGVIYVAPGDFDNDGLVDLCVLTEKGARLYRNSGGGRFVQVDAGLPAARFEAAVWLDFDHDYDLDLFLLGDSSVLLRNEGASGFHDYTSHFPFAKGRAVSGAAYRSDPDAKGLDLAVWYDGAPGILYRDRLRGMFEPSPMKLTRPPVSAEADFDGDGRLDVATVRADGRVDVAFNRTPAAGQWLAISLVGVKNLKSAAGAEVEVKAGDFYQRKSYAGVPVVFALGDHKLVDAIRVTWANGMIQNETNVAAGRAITIKEAPRLSGSCPMIFTWNGRAFQFITDVLGVAPLGASSGDGETFPVDHDEYVFIPGEALAAKSGRYQVRITEELHEVSYIDQVQLIAIDHPAEIEVYTNEKFKSPPFPEFRLYRAKRHLRPVRAVDGFGRDALASVLRRDGTYAGGFRHDSAGVAEPHSLVLDFGKEAASLQRPVLLLNGWVDWADGSTFFGASQGNSSGLIMPYLQVKDASGEWRTVVEDMGIPAGKPKTIAVDLTGKFLSRSREVRIVTNLCVYWDEIFLTDDETTAPVRQRDAAPLSAELRLRGFSRATIDAEREQPETFDYQRVTTAAPWNQTPGFYTRYGDVRQLLRDVDDRLVIMGAGDEIQLAFDAVALPDPAAGWRRDFLLKVDGWAKDADANTAYSQTVEPLPFHAMSAYPYRQTERFPDDPAHRVWRKQYNTRPAIRFIAPLLAKPAMIQSGQKGP